MLTVETHTHITAYTWPEHFRDEMVRGAFRYFVHDHTFTPELGGTLITDTCRFAAPYGPIGWVIERLVLGRYLRRFLAERAQIIKRVAESEEWRSSGTLYAATGNPIPAFAGHVREGENLYSNSLLALDVRRGTLRWFRQMVPHDTHDWDLTHAGPLFSSIVGGKPRDLIATAGKDGVLRTVDRTTHEILYETAVTTREGVGTPVGATGTRACPGFWGGVQWNGPAYSPRLQTLFVNAVDWCATYKLDQEIRRAPGRNHLGGTAGQDPAEKATGWLTAVDAGTGRIRWRYRSAAPLIAGIVATAGDLVFTGELTGDFLALDARSGEVLYRFNTGGPIGGGVISYSVEGTQYVAVMSGRPSRFSMGRDPGAPTVLVFGLGPQ